MPCPIDLYHGPASFLMSMPASFQSLISAICVPELSPREMKGAPLALMVCSAKAAFLDPLMLAGSSFGPMMTKSLYITEWRFTPNPSAMNFSSASLACTKTTSASPRRAVLSAWPVPWATTLTSMPVLALNSGRMWPNRPESCVEVVEATTMDLSRAPTGPAAMRATVAATTSRLRRVGIGALLFMFLYRGVGDGLDQQLAAHEAARLLGPGVGKECVGRAALDHAAAMQEHDLAGEALRLAEIVR